MTRTVWTCTAGAMLNQAAELMALDGCGFIPVVGDADGATDLEGVVTDRDIVLAAYLENKPLSAIPATSAMSPDVRVCYIDDSISLAEKLMCDNRVRRLPVLDFNDKLVGVISLDDIARQAQQEVRITGLMQVNQSAVAETLAKIAGRHHRKSAGRWH